MIARPQFESEEAAANALGRLLRDAGRHDSMPDADAGLERLLTTAAENSSQRTARRGWFGWALVAAAVAVIFVGTFAWYRHDTSALTFSVNGKPGLGRGAIATSSEHAVDVAFSDGTIFNVEPAARLRVDSSSANGAHLTLVEGKTIAHVVHRSKASWVVTAGPFDVQVTGTRFGATWSAANQRLSVELYEGSVQVVGGALSAPVAVRAGQRLEAGRGPGNWLLTSLDGPTTTLPRAKSSDLDVEPSSPSPRDQFPMTSPSSNVSGPASNNRPVPMRDWPAMLGRADFEGIVREANDFGIERCLSTCAPSDLRMLADSARYLGRYELAEHCLLALRKRSPSDAASAAFLLARLEESRDAHKALSWYERNLDEAPNGAYAAEAWAGEMRMLLQTVGASAAAPAAEQYLERFPGGVHAVKAREILSQSRTSGDRR